ncbi:MAG: R3H domain-containing nucleic acid-binding protein [bacterium]
MTPNINHQTTALIEEHVRHLISIMGFTRIKVGCSFRDVKGDQRLHIAIDAGPSGRLLIGARGAHLFALQHIVRSLMRRQLNESCRITVDVNGYLAGRERILLRLAEDAARQAGRTGQAVVLPPMVASERRTIHNSLASRQGVNTESLGDEPNRRVVVRSAFI